MNIGLLTLTFFFPIPILKDKRIVLRRPEGQAAKIYRFDCRV
jgi:hypothetical protein